MAVLRRAWWIGKNTALAGAVITSAPIVLALSFPFVVYLAGFACTRSLMRSLLPLSPKSHPIIVDDDNVSDESETPDMPPDVRPCSIGDLGSKREEDETSIEKEGSAENLESEISSEGVAESEIEIEGFEHSGTDEASNEEEGSAENLESEISSEGVAESEIKIEEGFEHSGTKFEEDEEASPHPVPAMDQSDQIGVEPSFGDDDEDGGNRSVVEVLVDEGPVAVFPDSHEIEVKPAEASGDEESLIHKYPLPMPEMGKIAVTEPNEFERRRDSVDVEMVREEKLMEEEEEEELENGKNEEPETPVAVPPDSCEIEIEVKPDEESVIHKYPIPMPEMGKIATEPNEVEQHRDRDDVEMVREERSMEVLVEHRYYVEPSLTSSEYASAVEDQSSDVADTESRDSGDGGLIMRSGPEAEFTTPSGHEDLYNEEKLWEQIYAIRTIVGYKATLRPSLKGELRALYLFTGIEPPVSVEIGTDLSEVSDKLQFLKSVIGVK